MKPICPRRCLVFHAHLKRAPISFVFAPNGAKRGFCMAAAFEAVEANLEENILVVILI